MQQFSLSRRLSWHCYKHKPSKFRRFLQYFFISFGVISFISILAIFALGFQTTQSFDKQFPHLFKQFIQTSLTEDVATALIIKQPLATGVSLEQAEKSLLAAAEKNQLKLIHHKSLDKTLSTKQTKQALSIFSFLPVAVSQQLLQQHPHFAAHLPFRMMLYQDLQGQAWIAMPNLPLLLHGFKQSANVQQLENLIAYEAMFKVLIASAYATE